MGSSTSKPNLTGNVLAMEREEKLEKLMKQWYEAVVQTAPPPLDDPNLLFHTNRTEYYYSAILHSTITVWFEVPGITVDWGAVNNTISSALTNATGRETGEGYGTCVIKSFDANYHGEACIFKLIVVAVSFNFSASDYQTSEDVAALGGWIYFLRADPPFRYNQEISEPIHEETLAYEVPSDMSIVGRRYMTVKELDRYNP